LKKSEDTVNKVEQRLNILGENDCFICKKSVKDEEAEFVPYRTNNNTYELLVHKAHKGVQAEDAESEE